MKHWVIVADTSSCRIFETDETMEAWTLLQTLGRERVSGARGPVPSGHGGVHSPFAHHPDPHELEQLQFARVVADQMNDAWVHGAWERAVLVAPPKFLGEVRTALSVLPARAVVASIHHDLTHLPAHELPAAVRKHMPATAGLELER